MADHERLARERGGLERGKEEGGLGDVLGRTELPGRLDVLSNGLCHSNDVAALRARLGPFVAAGLKGLALRRNA